MKDQRDIRIRELWEDIKKLNAEIKKEDLDKIEFTKQLQDQLDNRSNNVIEIIKKIEELEANAETEKDRIEKQ